MEFNCLQMPYPEWQVFRDSHPLTYINYLTKENYDNQSQIEQESMDILLTDICLFMDFMDSFCIRWIRN